MKITEGTMVVLKAVNYYLVAQFTPIVALLVTAADANTSTWPSALKITAVVGSGFIAGLIALRAFFDSSNARYEANAAKVVLPPTDTAK